MMYALGYTCYGSSGIWGRYVTRGEAEQAVVKCREYFHNLCKTTIYGPWMVEHTWMTCDVPSQMLHFVRDPVFDWRANNNTDPKVERKLRLLVQSLECRGWCGADEKRHDLFDDHNSLVCDLIRDVFGNPFAPAIDNLMVQSWLKWNDSAVRRLAEAIFEERRYDQESLLVLCDALEESGCTEERIISHLRGLEACSVCDGKGGWHRGHVRGNYRRMDADDIAEGWMIEGREHCKACHGTGKMKPVVHVPGCWAVDLLIGKEME